MHGKEASHASKCFTKAQKEGVTGKSQVQGASYLGMYKSCMNTARSIASAMMILKEFLRRQSK